MREQLGLEYLVSDVLELGKISDFDQVVAFFLLNHAQTKQQLLKMCQSISANLKQGGRFIAFNNNLELPPESYFRMEKYGRKQSISAPLQEGTPINVTLFNNVDDNTEECRFIDYYLSKATYEWAFQRVGFKEIRWHKPLVSPEDIQKYGQDFWQDFIDYPTLIGIECLK